MNDWRKALTRIESLDFDVGLNVLSDFRSITKAAWTDPAVTTLFAAMEASGEVQESILGRIFDLSRLKVDLRYQNPNDTALAILLWLTLFAAPEHAGLAAEVVDLAPQCWWAKKLARRIIVRPPVASGHSRSGDGSPGYGDTGRTSDSQVMTAILAYDSANSWHHDVVLRQPVEARVG